MKNQNTIVNTENCLFYGFPGIIILALSLMASTRISSDFGGDTFIKTVSFLGCNGLLWLLYLAVACRFGDTLYLDCEESKEREQH